MSEELERYTEATAVLAETFKASGKWAYTVSLDYSETAHRPSGYVDPEVAAVRALRTATTRGTSEVTFAELPEGWFMFVPDPPNGWPIMVKG
jgi:hypothetical protein